MDAVIGSGRRRHRRRSVSYRIILQRRNFPRQQNERGGKQDYTYNRSSNVPAAARFSLSARNP